MKILLVSLFLPQQKAKHAGGRYVFEIIRTLSKRHEIYLATRLEEGEVSELEELKPFCKEIYPYAYPSKEKRSLADSIIVVMNYIGFSLYADRVAREGLFDIIQVEWIEAALMMRRRRVPMILDAHDVITKPAERIAIRSRGITRPFNYLRYFFTRWLETRIVRKFDVVFARSEYDREYLLSMAPGLKVKTVSHPAGLDLDGTAFEKQENTILFLASYRHRKVNVDAALYFYQSVFPLVRKRVPGARFIIAGYGPPAEILALQEKDTGVAVTGFVDDIGRCYKQAAVFVAPILVGGGVIVKILDALAAGTPVVTTSYGNEGIRAVPGRDLLISDTPEGFADAVVQLLCDPVLADGIARSGKDFVTKHYGVESVMEEIGSSYEELMGR